MSNLMTSMNTGVSGLRVSQSALNTTAHNLANVDTKGYVRQQALITDFSYNTIGESYNSKMQVGLGTDMDVIRQVRDLFLDKSYRLEAGRQGFYEAQYEVISEVEDVFGELEGEAYQNTLKDLWTGLQELAKEPDSITKRAALIQTAVSFTERSENIYKQLNDYQVNLNTQILDKVERVNKIGDEIKELNSKISQYESTGQKANDYRDARNLLLDELGQLVKNTYQENAAGIVTINIEGVQFLSEDSVNYMGTAKVSEDTDMLKPIWYGKESYDVYHLDTVYSKDNNTDIGSLKGLLVARGSFPANYTDIPVKENYSSDAQYQEAVGRYNNIVSPSSLMAVQAEFDQLVHGVITTINDILSPNVSTKDYIKNMGISGASAGATEAQVDTAAAKALSTATFKDANGNTLTVDLNQVLLWDEANAPVGMDSDNTGREALFDRKSTARYTKATMTLNYDDADPTNDKVVNVYIYNKEKPSDNYTLYTLGEIEINEKIKENYSLLPLTSNQYSGKPGAFDLETCQKLTAAWQTLFATLGPDELTKNNFNDYYTAMTVKIGDRGKVFNTIATSQGIMVESIDNQRQQITGVSSDEELTNLIKYQHAYNAASRYITVIDQMLEHIISRL